MPTYFSKERVERLIKEAMFPKWAKRRLSEAELIKIVKQISESATDLAKHAKRVTVMDDNLKFVDTDRKEVK